jgi:hypothetical protein
MPNNKMFGLVSFQVLGMDYGQRVFLKAPKKGCMGQVSYVKASNQTPFSYHE